MLDICHSLNTICGSETHDEQDNKDVSYEEPLKVKYRNLFKDGDMENNIMPGGRKIEKKHLSNRICGYDLPLDFPSSETNVFSLEEPMLFIPVFRMEKTHGIEMISECFENDPQRLLFDKLKQTWPINGSKGFSSNFGTNFLDAVTVNGEDIQQNKDLLSEKTTGYLILTDPLSHDNVMYLAIFVRPISEILSRMAYLINSDGAAASSEHQNSLMVIKIALRLDKFRTSLPLNGSINYDKEFNPFSIEFDKQDLILPESTLTLELEGEFKGLDTEFIIKKTFSAPGITDMRFKLCRCRPDTETWIKEIQSLIAPMNQRYNNARQELY
ncbi:hypothetical protein CDIK_1538 [Cucumispora dikerogammari]|nr:hypothetical protein CDIK_1538 [Cucumispora dikerogammari]